MAAVPDTGRTGGRRRSVQAGALVGVGVAAFLDEAVFHQVLHWHHFYDRGTSDAGLVSDGFFHAGSFLATLAGMFLLADTARRGETVRRAAWGAFLLAAGVFQLYDGLVQHKLLHLHQVRYGVELLPYDLAWNLPGVLAALAGALLLRRRRA